MQGYTGLYCDTNAKGYDDDMLSYVECLSAESVISVSLPPSNKAIPAGQYFNVIPTTLNA